MPNIITKKALDSAFARRRKTETRRWVVNIIFRPFPGRGGRRGKAMGLRGARWLASWFCLGSAHPVSVETHVCQPGRHDLARCCCLAQCALLARDRHPGVQKPAARWLGPASLPLTQLGLRSASPPSLHLSLPSPRSRARTAGGERQKPLDEERAGPYLPETLPEELVPRCFRFLRSGLETTCVLRTLGSTWISPFLSLRWTFRDRPWKCLPIIYIDPIAP